MKKKKKKKQGEERALGIKRISFLAMTFFSILTSDSKLIALMS